MKRILLATAAALVLSLPAMAAQPTSSATTKAPPPQATQQHQSSKMNTTMRRHEAKNEQRRINPKTLSKQEVMQIQQALNKKGFSAKHVDGVWGRETDTALRNFQKKERISGNGHLNRQTLAALGVNFTPKAERSTVGSGSSATGSKTTNHMNNSKTMNHTNKSSSEMNQKK